MQPTPDSLLFRPFKLGAVELADRVVMAPRTRSRSDDQGVPPPFAADHDARRATAGLIASEATNVSRQARGCALTPGIWAPAQVEAWRAVTRAVRKQGGRVVLQLWHTGRISHPSLRDGALPVAPSAIKPAGQAFTNAGPRDHVTPRALATDEIPAIVADHRHAAGCAKEAGFDGVEIHSANNHPLEPFIRGSTNRRTDRYGGPVANRLRFPLEVVAAVTEAWGGGERVGIRISPGTTQPGGAPLDGDPMGTYGAYLDALSGFGLMYVHDIEGVTQVSREAGGVDHAALRRRFAGAWIANNGHDRALAERTLRDGSADLVSFARPFLANPDLVERLRSGAPLAEAPKPYGYGGDATGYSDWPGMRGQVELAA